MIITSWVSKRDRIGNYHGLPRGYNRSIIREEQIMKDRIVAEFFNRDVASGYDARTQRTAALIDNLHFLIRLVLEGLPANARILCIGVGTGSEMARLAEIFPGWHFTGVDPSAAMLDICRQRVRDQRLEARCELIEGYVADAPTGEPFDAVLCLLVAHFLKELAERQALFDEMVSRLRPGGYLVNAEICADVDSPLFDALLVQWKAMHRHAGATEENLANVEQTLRETIAVLPPATTESLLRNSGLPLPVQFFQSLLIRAWYSRKPL
jgi:tRNA (cmo5U34)-methyltransferase